MGRWAVRAITRLGSAARLLIADLDFARAEQVAAEVGPPCQAISLDATDPRALREVFSRQDVVLNTMGPFALYSGPILSAAIEEDCDYLDIDDDWESTVAAFELDGTARERGLRVIKGLGGSPGTSNLLARLAAERLDRVDELLTGWAVYGAVVADEPDYPPPSSAAAAVEHWLIQCSGTIRAWRYGEESDLRPMERVELEYPGIGSVPVYTVGHPEALTLPRYVDGLSSSLNVMSGPAWLFDHVRRVAAAYDAGEVTLAEGAVQLQRPAVPSEKGPRDPLPIVWALARGERAQDPVDVAVHPRAFPKGKMGGNTGVPLAIGLELLRQGRVGEPGVHAPEGVIEPDEFFEYLARLVEPACSSAGELLAIEERVSGRASA